MTPIERAEEAQRKARERSLRSRRRERFRGGLREAAVQEWIVDRLVVEKWTLEMVANSVSRYFPSVKFSLSTLYRFFKSERRELIKHLPQKGKPYRQRIRDRRGTFGTSRLIDERPNIQGEFGHFEIDTIVSSKNTVSILSGRERLSRLVMLRKVANLQAETIKPKLHAYLQYLPEEALRTLTHDNGPEFSNVYQLCSSFPIETYRCNPHCAWERGSVENLNKLLRRFFPKGMDLSLVSDEELKQVETMLNNRPMKCLGWRTPNEVFAQLVGAP
jgi:IS30 family transposase